MNEVYQTRDEGGMVVLSSEERQPARVAVMTAQVEATHTMVNDEKEPLKDRARRLREARGMTQKELAQKADVSPTHVYQIEAGLRKRMHLDTLKRYARALGVSPQYLDAGYDDVPSEGKEWPSIAVLLRNANPLLDEGAIDQVTRLVQALEAQAEMELMRRGGFSITLEGQKHHDNSNGGMGGVA